MAITRRMIVTVKYEVQPPLRAITRTPCSHPPDESRLALHLRPPASTVNRLPAPSTACNRLRPPETACVDPHTKTTVVRRIGSMHWFVPIIRTSAIDPTQKYRQHRRDPSSSVLLSMAQASAINFFDAEESSLMLICDCCSLFNAQRTIPNQPICITNFSSGLHSPSCRTSKSSALVAINRSKFLRIWLAKAEHVPTAGQRSEFLTRNQQNRHLIFRTFV